MAAPARSSSPAWTPAPARIGWPPLTRVYQEFHSLVAACHAARFFTDIDPRFTKWSQVDTDYLLDHAGIETLTAIAKTLGRSVGATRARLQQLGLKARTNQGWLSAHQIALEYNTSYHRVRELLKANRIPGAYDAVRRSWRVDPDAIDDDVEAILRAPKRTWTSTPPSTRFDNEFVVRKIHSGRFIRLRKEP